MKKFNLEEALAGKPVITRSGEEVTQLVLFKVDGDSPLVGVVGKVIKSYAKEGNWLPGKDSSYDLFMKPTKKSGWVAVLKFANGQVVMAETIHKTKQDAENVVWTHCDVLDIIEITWEE